MYSDMKRLIHMTFDLSSDELLRVVAIGFRHWCVLWWTAAGVTFVTATVDDATATRIEKNRIE